MTDTIGNDNQPPGARAEDGQADPCGAAALLLVESLLHALIGRSHLSVADAVEVLDVAIDIREEAVVAAGVDPADSDRALGLLAAIHMSLSRDLPPATAG